MTEKRGEISVFLSLTLVCILSLFLGLVESARTAGARLYLEMAADSAMASVMSQYNRNLWDMYGLLFLEAESERAVAQSFTSYLSYYVEQENLYPMEITDVEVRRQRRMTDEGGRALEQEILSSVSYRLPEIAADFTGISEAADHAKTVGDFRELLTICRSTGRRTRRLEKYRRQIETCIGELKEEQEKLKEAVSKEQFESSVLEFETLLRQYDEEIQAMSSEVEEMKERERAELEDGVARESLHQEIFAYEQVIQAAEEQKLRYQELDFTSISEPLPETAENQENIRALDRLETILQGDILDLILDETVAISRNSVRMTGSPSSLYQKGAYASEKDADAKGNGDVQENPNKNRAWEQFMIHEYCFLSFESFFSHGEQTLSPDHRPLQYEQEYLLCGEASDRKNLKETAEKLLTVRGALNFLYLLQNPDCKAEADALAATVSGGSVPVQTVLSLFILAVWAFGEAVWDVKVLMKGGSVSFFKNASEWRLGLKELLELQFLEQPTVRTADGKDYRDYLRVLFLMLDSTERNYRIMDLIQWNVQTVQDDFLVSDCLSEVKIRVTVAERHLFLTKSEYSRSAEVTGTY